MIINTKPYFSYIFSLVVREKEQCYVKSLQIQTFNLCNMTFLSNYYNEKACKETHFTGNTAISHEHPMSVVCPK